MQKILSLLLLSFALTPIFVQAQRKVTTYFLAQYNNTIKDVTLGNNPWGMGLGVQSFLNNKTKFKPTIELTGDIYLADDKVFRTDSTGTPFNEVGGMTNLFIGSSFHPTKNIYGSFVAGPSLLGGQTLFGIKPTFGFFFSNKQRITGKLSYINIFNRGEIIKEDFTSWSIALGVKLF